MIRILYFSTAAADVGSGDVDQIVDHARERNAARGITGALAFNGRNFCQILEGEEEAVMSLIDTIAEDPRHSGFKILDSKDIKSRHFANWSMQRVDRLDFSTVINAMDA